MLGEFIIQRGHNFVQLHAGNNPQRYFPPQECNHRRGDALLPNPRRVSKEFHTGTSKPNADVRTPSVIHKIEMERNVHNVMSF